MLEFMGTVVLNLIKKELVNAEPELEALIIGELEKLAKMIMKFGEDKLNPPAVEESPGAALWVEPVAVVDAAS